MKRLTGMETFTKIVVGANRVRGVVNGLLNDSQWFQVLPLPEDEYAVAVKIENKAKLNRLAERTK